MSSIIRTILFALYATILTALSDVSRSTTCVMAFPLRPPILVSRIASSYSYLSVNMPQASRPPMNVKRRPDTKTAFLRSTSPGVVIARAPPTSDDSSHQDIADHLSRLAGHYAEAEKDSKSLKVLAARSASVQEDDIDFQQQSKTQVAAFSENILYLQGILGELGADKGQAFYDPTDKLEVLLRDVVQLLKATLKDIDTIIFHIPVLGPILEPIVYEIKCFVDFLLNITENLVDALLIQPLLPPPLAGPL